MTDAPLTARAEALLEEWIENDGLRKHCRAVSASLRHQAEKHGADPDLWAAVGLLHDLDYERHPVPDPAAQTGHPWVAAEYLRTHGWSEEICRAILSHADYSGVTRESLLEKSLYAVDELSGFVTAVALVRPSRSVREVEVSSVKKKLKDKGFARAVNREDIARGAAELGLPAEELIAQVIAALRADADRLGLAGETGGR